MPQAMRMLTLSIILAVAQTATASAAEREQVRMVINLVSGVKMPFPEHLPIAHVIEFFSRSTKRGDQFRDKFQKMYDEGIQIALKYFGE